MVSSCRGAPRITSYLLLTEINFCTNISRIKFSRLVKKPRNQRKFSPLKNLGYTVYTSPLNHAWKFRVFVGLHAWCSVVL